MKKNKKIMGLGIILTGALTVGVITSFAIDPLTSQMTTIKMNKEINNKAAEEVLVEVGSSKITSIEFLNNKEQNSITPSNLSDSEILEHMVKEELFLQLAEKEGVSAALEEGIKEAQKNRKILSQQPREIQDTHKKLIKEAGVTEEEHWEKIAPPEYQNMLSKQNLAAKIRDEAASAQKLNNDEDAVIYLKEFKDDLLKTAISDGTVKVVSKNINLE
ncbi:hypothetical protein [Paenibacillus dakarensis]|uniref:hypothetical protein n=1 Tax=Paenibacillus dakarensis TaxID=1527293 RepID=UPI0006D57B87|nr:hypothetical protein [Paenibacillus dakarensis]